MRFSKKRFGARSEELKKLERTFITEARRMGFDIKDRELCSTNSCYLTLSVDDVHWITGGAVAGKVRISDHGTGIRGDWDLDATIFKAEEIPGVLQILFKEMHDPNN